MVTPSTNTNMLNPPTDARRYSSTFPAGIYYYIDHEEIQPDKKDGGHQVMISRPRSPCTLKSKSDGERIVNLNR